MLKLKFSFCNVTCTGTPGIGKSVFIHYFIEEYFKHNPSANMLLSTFSSDGKHKASQWIFQSKTKIEMKEVDISLKVSAEKTLGIPKDTLIYLFDGWSELGMPQFANRLIAFPSPNSKWFKENAKSSFHVFFFPLRFE
jgi:hypothetical protein